MSDEEADVIALFVALEDSFLGASKKGQRGLAEDTKRYLLHDDATDTVAWGCSDDSLQCLLAGAQKITGDKEFSGEVTFDSTGEVQMISDMVLGKDTVIYGTLDAEPDVVQEILSTGIEHDCCGTGYLKTIIGEGVSVVKNTRISYVIGEESALHLIAESTMAASIGSMSSPVTMWFLGLSGMQMQHRFQELKGVNAASANDLQLPIQGNYFLITGSTQINRMYIYGWQEGSGVTLEFAASCTIKHNQTGSSTYKPFLLTGHADFVAAAGDTLALRYNGTAWREQSRSVL